MKGTGSNGNLKQGRLFLKMQRTFQIYETWPTESIKRKCLKKQKALKDQNIIDQAQYFRLKSTDRSSHRDYFREYLFFSSRSTFFCSNLNVSTEQIVIFQEGISVRRTDTIFPGAAFICSLKRYQFSRRTFFGYRTDTNFPVAPFLLPNR